MGVDISGMNPIIRSPKPEYPNWETATQEEKDAYFEASNKWEKENPGDYFRSNWWGWRPIVMLCEYASEENELNIDFSYWGSNDGTGLDNQEDWPLHIINNQGIEDKVYLNVGDIIFYESARLLHGRPTPLLGNYYSIVMTHLSIVGYKHKPIDNLF